VESDGQPAAAMGQQIFVTLIGLFGRRKAGELTHRPQPAAIAGGVNAARVWRLPGMSEISLGAPVLRKIGLRVQTPNRHSRNGRKAGVAVFVEVYARGRADRLLRRFFQGRGKRL